MSNSRVRSHSSIIVAGAVVMLFATFTGCSKSKSKTGDKTESAKTTNNGKTPKGGNGGNGSTVKAKKPCDFVTLDEVNKITGANFTNVTSAGNPVAVSVCTYSDEKGKSLLISVTRQAGAAKIAGHQNFSDNQPIKGLGDEANWVPVPGYLTVRKGKGSLTVTITGRKEDAETRLKHAKVIAKIGLKRM